MIPGLLVLASGASSRALMIGEQGIGFNEHGVFGPPGLGLAHHATKLLLLSDKLPSTSKVTPK